ncbi:Uncharacterised protein [Helicobacter cinaedi]|uniref:Outer membrane beta-barrel protein n=1 Tax=Helicobacter cinaedi TaxID=213 RepID=A0A377JQT5_9HELI|nr:hypothetical protein [Helicobacter cinaedi]STP10184.1 Uncharacterised protein [Helicobacter cinaedi]
MYRIAFVLCCIWCFASVAKAENLSQENTTDLLKIHPNDTEQIIESHKLGFEIDEMQVSILPTMIWGGTLPQLISFHLGYNATQLDFKIQSGGSVGASAGLNYLLPNPLYWNLSNFGLRVRYLYEYGAYSSHLLGVVSYWHLVSENFKTFAFLPTIVLGGGWIINAQKQTESGYITSNGSYIEAGLAFFKWFPVGNVDILYRASFYDNPLVFGTDKAVHSINFVFTFF